MNYLLDTNVISELISKSPHAGIIEFLNATEEKSLFLSVITLGEIKVGIEKLPDGNKKEKLKNWLEIDLLNRFNERIIDVDLGVMMLWGEIVNRSQSLGRPLPIMDSLIAAQCALNNLTLITRNQKDSENLSLTIINPFK